LLLKLQQKVLHFPVFCLQLFGFYKMLNIKMQSVLFIIGLSLTAFNVTAAGTSTFDQTCTKISITGDVIHAECRKKDQTPHKTQIALVGIENINGTLTITGKKTSFQETCSNISISGHVLKATCRKRDQSNNNTSLILQGIANIDGTLTYTPTGK